MINQVNLTDDELAAIQTSLQMTLMSIEKYEKEGNVLDYPTQEVKKDVQMLFDRFNKEYF